MLIEIKSRFDSRVIFSHDCENNSIRLTVEAAVKAGANLVGANLARANLARANLTWANLTGANLTGANLAGATYGIATLTKGVLQLLGLYWSVLIFDAHIKIGCEFHSTQEWIDFDDVEIADMETCAAEFWKKNRDLILMAAKIHQGE